MMRTHRRMAIIGGAVVVVACSAALAFHFMGGSKDPREGLVALAPRTGSPSVSEDTEGAVDRSFGDYGVVTQRNVFQPLLSEPRETASLTVPSEIPSPRTSNRPSARAPQPPDPTKDLAMTGVVESDAGLKALIKNTQTGASVYAAMGELAFDLRVAGIEAKRTTLARGDREYTLEMGAKEVPGETPQRASAPPPSTASAASAPSGESPRPGFGPPGGSFGPGDWGRRLEDAYRSGRISREQYDRARRSMSERGGRFGPR